MQDACLGGKDSTRKDMGQLDLLFDHLVIRSLILCLVKCFPLIIDRCPLFGHFGFLSF